MLGNAVILWIIDIEHFFKPVKCEELIVITSEVISNTVLSSKFLNNLYYTHFKALYSCERIQIINLLRYNIHSTVLDKLNQMVCYLKR